MKQTTIAPWGFDMQVVYSVYDDSCRGLVESVHVAGVDITEMIYSNQYQIIERYIDRLILKGEA